MHIGLDPVDISRDPIARHVVETDAPLDSSGTVRPRPRAPPSQGSSSHGSSSQTSPGKPDSTSTPPTTAESFWAAPSSTQLDISRPPRMGPGPVATVNLVIDGIDFSSHSDVSRMTVDSKDSNRPSTVGRQLLEEESDVDSVVNDDDTPQDSAREALSSRNSSTKTLLRPPSLVVDQYPFAASSQDEIGDAIPAAGQVVVERGNDNINSAFTSGSYYYDDGGQYQHQPLYDDAYQQEYSPQYQYQQPMPKKAGAAASAGQVGNERRPRGDSMDNTHHSKSSSGSSQRHPSIDPAKGVSAFEMNPAHSPPRGHLPGRNYDGGMNSLNNSASGTRNVSFNNAALNNSSSGIRNYQQLQQQQGRLAGSGAVDISSSSMSAYGYGAALQRSRSERQLVGGSKASNAGSPAQSSVASPLPGSTRNAYGGNSVGSSIANPALSNDDSRLRALQQASSASRNIGDSISNAIIHSITSHTNRQRDESRAYRSTQQLVDSHERTLMELSAQVERQQHATNDINSKLDRLLQLFGGAGGGNM
jgi:hypothetical protein